MKRITLLFATAVVGGFAALSVAAHDPSDFDRMFEAPAALAEPTTCAQLADPDRYSTDETNPDIKKLRTRCDAEKTAAPADKPTDAEKPSDKKNEAGNEE